jgi:hypothetical protein
MCGSRHRAGAPIGVEKAWQGFSLALARPAADASITVMTFGYTRSVSLLAELSSGTGRTVAARWNHGQAASGCRSASPPLPPKECAMHVFFYRSDRIRVPRIAARCGLAVCREEAAAVAQETSFGHRKSGVTYRIGLCPAARGQWPGFRPAVCSRWGVDHGHRPGKTGGARTGRPGCRRRAADPRTPSHRSRRSTAVRWRWRPVSGPGWAGPH